MNTTPVEISQGKCNLLVPALTAVLHWGVFWAVCFSAEISSAQNIPLGYEIKLVTARSGFDKQRCWVHPRAGVIPPGAAGNESKTPLVVMTMQELLLSGSDVFYELNMMRTADLGQTWQAPVPQKAFVRQERGENIEVIVCDFAPKWHAASGKLLGTGQTAYYENNHIQANRLRQPAYSFYDPAQGTWQPWKTVKLPAEEKFENAGAGSVQRVDLPNGEILLPIYFKPRRATQYSTTVLRCRVEKDELKYVAHGDELTVPVKRGFAEPSLTKFQNRYYLTLRNDVQGYVTSGDDGQHFAAPQSWKFDDGSELGNYNTQQHWVTHQAGLFLVYTRRGAENDHVFRHRAPLFMAQVDPEKLCVIRATERILIPQRGARLGNFGVVDVSPDETWVTVAEWMQPAGVEKHGSDNSVYAARILWSRPNGMTLGK